MKVLHINNFGYPDYQNDMVFHGGRSVLGSDYVESHTANYMYESSAVRKSLLYGKGFTLYCRLPDIQPDNTDLYNKIANRHFDYIIYGSVFRNLDYWDIVSKAYPKNKIIFIDGEDHQGIRWDVVSKGNYFKRECIISYPNVHPITFAIPKELIRRGTKKTKDFAHIDPANRSTYIFDNENEYYADYAQSYFAYTQKKAGWDCLRHYEILMNGCMPAFRDIEKCPQLTMAYFPKSYIEQYYIKHGWNFSADYWEYLDRMVDVIYNRCTTEAIFNYILETVE